MPLLRDSIVAPGTAAENYWGSTDGGVHCVSGPYSVTHGRLMVITVRFNIGSVVRSAVKVTDSVGNDYVKAGEWNPPNSLGMAIFVCASGKATVSNNVATIEFTPFADFVFGYVLQYQNDRLIAINGTAGGSTHGSGTLDITTSSSLPGSAQAETLQLAHISGNDRDRGYSIDGPIWTERYPDGVAGLSGAGGAVYDSILEGAVLASTITGHCTGVTSASIIVVSIGILPPNYVAPFQTPPDNQCCNPPSGPNKLDGGTGAYAVGWGDWETHGFMAYPPCVDMTLAPAPGATVAPHESYGASNDQPAYFWARVTLPAPPGGTPETIQFAMHQAIPDRAGYMGGYKPQKIKSVSQIARNVSNIEGDYVGSSVDFLIDDQDKSMRKYIDPLLLKYFTGAHVTYYMVSEAFRRTQALQRPFGRGVLRDYSFTEKYGWSFAIEDWLTSEYGPLSSEKRITTRTLTKGLFPNIPIVNDGTPARFVIGPVTDMGAWKSDDPSRSAIKGMVPCTTVGGMVINGKICTELYVCSNAVDRVDICASNIEGAARYQLDEFEYGNTVWAPGHAGWPFPQNYFEKVNTVTGRLERYTSVFISGYFADYHNSGQVTAAANVCGIPIVNLFDAWKWVCDNLVFDPIGYHAGNYAATSPTFPDGTPSCDAATFAAAQALSQKWIGRGRSGYKGGVLVDGSMLTKDVMKYFAQSTGARYGWTRTAQFGVFLYDDTQDQSTMRKLRAPIEVRGSTAPRYTNDQLANPITYNFDYDADAQHYRGEPGTVRDQQAINATGGRDRPLTIEMRFTRYLETAIDVASRALLWRRLPFPVVDIQLPLGGLDLELYESVLLSSPDGEGDGWSNVQVRIDGVAFDPKTRRNVATGTVVRSGTSAISNWHDLAAQTWASIAAFTWDDLGSMRWI